MFQILSNSEQFKIQNKSELFYPPPVFYDTHLKLFAVVRHAM